MSGKLILVRIPKSLKKKCPTTQVILTIVSAFIAGHTTEYNFLSVGIVYEEILPFHVVFLISFSSLELLEELNISPSSRP